MGIQKGLQQLLMHLRMTESAANSSLSDVVIVSLDLEVSRRCRQAIKLDKGYQPVIKELGIASIDTRQIFDQPAECMPASTKRRIKTQQFSTLNASKDFEDCDVTNFTECEFAETLHVLPEQLIPIVARAVRIQEDDRAMTETGASTLRHIIIVGHSIAGDLAILKRLGFNMHKEKSLVAILDTYSLSKTILTGERAAGRYSLSGVLTALSCPHEPRELHNAGNDATYTLLVILMLASSWAKENEGLLGVVAANERRLQAFALAEANSFDRWKPIRCSLGAHVDETCS